MDTDMIFVMGFVLLVLSIPAMLSAFLDGRTPRAPALIIMIGVLMVGYAVHKRPMTYSVERIPDTFLRVYADFTR